MVFQHLKGVAHMANKVYYGMHMYKSLKKIPQLQNEMHITVNADYCIGKVHIAQWY